jgi:hypothetical protein
MECERCTQIETTFNNLEKPLIFLFKVSIFTGVVWIIEKTYRIVTA